MTSVEIKENNKLLAEFLGYKYFGFDRSKAGVKPGWKTHNNTTSEKLFYLGNVGERHYLCRGHNDLRFYNSWDWLMAVVDKIESLGGDYCLVTSRFGYSIYTGAYGAIDAKRSDFDKNINCLYFVVAEFVKWYNNEMSERK